MPDGPEGREGSQGAGTQPAEHAVGHDGVVSSHEAVVTGMSLPLAPCLRPPLTDCQPLKFLERSDP